MLNETQNILDRLAVADRAHQKEAGWRLLLRSVKYVCAFVLLAFVLDATFHLSAGWRLWLLLALFAGALLLMAASGYLACVRRNRLEHIARFLEGRDPALGSRLINLLQLQEQTRDPSLTPLTRDLARQAVEGYAAELRGTPLEQLAWTGALRRYLKSAAWALLGFATVCTAFFRITAVELARFVDPFGDHPPYSFTRLEIIEPGAAGTNVIYGKGFVVTVKASGHQPKEVFLSSFPPDHPEQTTTVPMFDRAGSGFGQLVGNIRTELRVVAHTKDGSSRSKQVRIGVELVPRLERAHVQITPPAYTGLKPEEKPYAFKSVEALAGSELRFRLESNRPLREGRIEFSRGGQAPQYIAMTNSGEYEVTGSFAATDSGRLRFSLTDVAGLPSQADWEGALTVKHDLPPEIRIVEPERDALVAMDFKLRARVEAVDDYGLSAVRLHRGLNGIYSPPQVVSYKATLRESRETMDFDIAGLGVAPGDVISLFAEAVDTAPEPHLARSQTVRLMVISVEDYNNLLREQTDLADAEAKYASLLADLQELVEEQKKLGEVAEKLQARIEQADAGQREELTRQLDGLLARQNELNQKLNQHAGRMDQFVRDDPLYDVEKELQALLQQQSQTIRQSTQTNSAEAAAVARQSAPESGPRQLSPEMVAALKRASDDQVARLGGVQNDTEKQVVETLQDMSLMQELQKDFSQFNALYETQQELAAQAQAYNRPGELSREDQLALKELAATQKEAGDRLAHLEQKLREDADAAATRFPKAAQSGRDLAGQIKAARLEPLTRQATGQMLAADGEQSYNLAERVRSEMEKLFAECQGGNCPSGNELDGYLSLQRGMNPGRNFAQMARSRKFGGGQSGQGLAGMSGTSGYAVANSSSLAVMGNEFTPSRGSATARQSRQPGKGPGLDKGGTLAAESSASEPLKSLNPVNRQSSSVASEATLEEYNDVVEGYFKAITTRSKP